jgi:hypothetical protein
VYHGRDHDTYTLYIRHAWKSTLLRNMPKLRTASSRLWSTSSPASSEIQKRKRTATINPSSIHSPTALGSDGEDRLSREALQPHPSPPMMHSGTGPSQQWGKNRVSSRSRKQTAIKVKTLAYWAAAGSIFLTP